MLLLFLLSAIMILSLAVYQWLGDTALARGRLIYVCSPLIAMVLISVMYDISLVTSLPYWSFLLISVSIGLAVLYHQWRKGAYNPVHIRMPGLYALIVLGLIYYLSYIFIQLSVRWGRTDARAIWSLHALFLTDTQHWRNMFTNTISWSHPDYPLLLPSCIAIFWRAIGNADPLVPCALAYATFIAVLITLSGALRDASKYFPGIIALLAFAYTPAFAEMASFQGADTLLSLFILMTLVLARQRAWSTKLILLTGFMAGFAGWVKNEGLAFTAIFSIVMFWQYRNSPVKIIYYLSGLALPLFIIIVFKVHYAPSDYLIAEQNHSILQRLRDTSRYFSIGTFFCQTALRLYPSLLLILVLILVKGYRRIFDSQLLVLLSMLLVYYVIFIITPRELRWHLETASDRLFLQLFPAFLYVLMDLLGGE